MNEKKALKRLRKGQLSALDELISFYTPYVYAVVSNVLGGVLPEEDAEEIVSDSFLALWNSRDKIKDDNIKAWLAAVARNKARSRLRSLRINSSLEEDMPIAQCQEPEAQAVIKELTAIARDAVDSLPEPDREIFKRHYFLYQKTEDISAQMGIKAATVRTKLARGREKLKARLKEWGYEYEDTYN